MTHPRWDPAVVERVARGILTASYPDLTWDSDLDHDDQVYMRRLAGAALDTLDEMGCLTPSGQRQPLAWSLPTEPGPEVTAVRAARPLYGLTLWRRAHTADLGHHWQLRRGDGQLLCTVADWGRLLARYGPLTEASNDQTEGNEP